MQDLSPRASDLSFSALTSLRSHETAFKETTRGRRHCDNEDKMAFRIDHSQVTTPLRMAAHGGVGRVDARVGPLAAALASAITENRVPSMRKSVLFRLKLH